MFTESVSSAVLEKSMSAMWQKAQLITHNLTNEDTPGYKAKRMEFEGLLRSAMEKNTRVSAWSREDRINRIRELSPRVYSDESTEGRVDGNNVDKDAEHIELARVQLQYQALRDKLNGHYSLIRYAISGGR